MITLKKVATIVCENEWDGGNRGCTETATFEAPLSESRFQVKARAHFAKLGWSLDPHKCPYCAAGRPSDD